MTPLDAFARALSASLINSRVRGGVPGECVRALGREAREALARLTSDELATLRVDPRTFCDPGDTPFEQACNRYAPEQYARLKGRMR